VNPILFLENTGTSGFFDSKDKLSKYWSLTPVLKVPAEIQGPVNPPQDRGFYMVSLLFYTFVPLMRVILAQLFYHEAQ